MARNVSRRRLLQASALAGVASAAGCTALTGGGGADYEATAVGPDSSWPTNRGNEQRTGHVLGTPLKEEPSVAWTQDVAGEYLAASDGVVFAAGGEALEAIDAERGETTWRRGESDPFELNSHKPPTVADGTLVEVATDVETAADIYAFDVETGDLRWQHATKEVHSPPLVVDETVVVSARRKLYAWDLESGEEQWRLDLAGQVSAVDGTMYVAGGRNGLQEVDPSTGSKQQRNDVFLHWPSYVDGTVYHFSMYMEELVATDVSSGDSSWTFDIGSLNHTKHTVAGDLVLVGNRSGKLYALDRQDGSERWTATTSGAFYTPIVVQDTVYLTTNDGAVVALSLDGGNERWRKDLGEGIVGRPAFMNGKLYVVHDDQVKALEPA